MRTFVLLLGVALPLVFAQQEQQFQQQPAFPSNSPVSHGQGAPPAGKPPPAEVSRASNEFANELYKQLSGTPGNVLVCPLSLHVALSLVQTGADGKTKSQLTQALKFLSPNSDVKGDYKLMLDSILNDQNVLKVATKMFPAKNYKLIPQFQKDAKDYFQSEIDTVNYEKPATAAKTINDYVEQKTNKKITDLISSDALTPQTKLIIVNAVHFQSNWLKPFPTSFDEDFFISPQEKVKTRMMGQTDYFPYKDDADLNAKVLRMDYDKGGFSMIIVLPNNPEELKNTENKLSQKLVGDLLAGMKNEKVEVIIPKFRLEQTLDLKDTLIKMGIEDMFGPKADLSKVVMGEKIYVSSVVQKTFIDVHENGTEAAAATVVLETLSANNNKKVFFARTLFFFYLVHTDQQLVMFEGRYKRPIGQAEPRDEPKRTTTRRPENKDRTKPAENVQPASTNPGSSAFGDRASFLGGSSVKHPRPQQPEVSHPQQPQHRPQPDDYYVQPQQPQYRPPFFSYFLRPFIN